MNSEKPLVSIITPLYNSELFIADTINSVLNQTYQNWEMIIVDDSSTDNGCKVVEELIKIDDRVKLFKNETNIGAAKIRNKCIDLAKGRFIAFLDSDDLWYPDKLEVQINFMLENKYALTYSFYQQINENNDFIKNVNKIPLKLNYNILIKRNWIGCLTGVYDTEIVGKVFMPDIRKRQDFGLWLRIIKKIDYAHCLPEILASYRVRKESVSSNKLGLLKYHWHLYRNIEKLPFNKSISLLIGYFLIKVFKL